MGLYTINRIKQQPAKRNCIMNLGKRLTTDQQIKNALETTKTIAILGLSPKPERDSYKVAKYLKEHGYKIIPVRPGQNEILGEKAYASLDEIKEPVDMVNVFRRSEQVPVHAEEAIGIKPCVFWMQLGIENIDAADVLNAKGIDVVMNRCIKVEHHRLFA
jgi:predicted CoA-binding protein